MRYDTSTFTWGAELELGDIPRDFKIPEHLGRWDQSETEILNLREPYAGRASDPQGIDPPMGGEINTRPTRSMQEQVDRIWEILEMFTQMGHPPTNCHIQALHIHCHVPGLTSDVEGLRSLTRYIKTNQDVMTKAVHGTTYDSRMKLQPGGALTYTGHMRNMPDWYCDNICTAKDFEDFIRLHCTGKDAKSMGRPLRYVVNTYNLKHTQTVEFRAFVQTLVLKRLQSAFEITRAFMDSALNGGPSILEHLAAHPEWEFELFQYNPYHHEAWAKTKWPKERGQKNRVFIPPENLE